MPYIAFPGFSDAAWKAFLKNKATVQRSTCQAAGAFLMAVYHAPGESAESGILLLWLTSLLLQKAAADQHRGRTTRFSIRPFALNREEPLNGVVEVGAVLLRSFTVVSHDTQEGLHRRALTVAARRTVEDEQALQNTTVTSSDISIVSGRSQSASGVAASACVCS